MQLIKLHKNKLAAYVPVNKIAVIQNMRNAIHKEIGSVMYIDGEWRMWDEDIHYIYKQIKPYLNYILKLERADTATYSNIGAISYVNAEHISIFNSKKEFENQFSSRTCINGYWFMWKETINDIMSQLNIKIEEGI